MRKLVAEALGTFWLVLGGCGSAVLSGRFPEVGIGILGISLAFGLAVVSGAYALGPVSGGHFNPAVTVGLWAGGRFRGADVPGYVAAQVAGAIAGAGILYMIASGGPGFDPATARLGSNGYGEFSPGKYSLLAGVVGEVTTTAVFVVVILGATHRRAPGAFGGLVIGLTLVLIHLLTIPVTGTSVNPARSTGPALYAGGAALQQLWLFWVAPLVGALVGGYAYRALWETESEPLVTGQAHA